MSCQVGRVGFDRLYRVQPCHPGCRRKDGVIGRKIPLGGSVAPCKRLPSLQLSMLNVPRETIHFARTPLEVERSASAQGKF